MTIAEIADITNTSTSAQRARILKHLQSGPLTTIEARTRLNVMHPAARIQELRLAGYPIKTHQRTALDDQGRRHGSVAVYYLTAS
ncbi:Helix-turn-helix domain-containing protein [Pseudomonas sp. BS3767]|uniref:helix-turn-helix domain-containing protein n=1 Tax=Pseudomonas TaxID=286 RepID=UPI000881D106|nr:MULTISPECIES: helix-turn-helix domain-containing protein [Pseudomonas]RXU25526.1 hypothetical protein B0A92_10360 [Pseudomonas syringae]SDI56895.1 Helix-turn-helix domain-containing protein [Pseudomonas sp. BS3767]